MSHQEQSDCRRAEDIERKVLVKSSAILVTDINFFSNIYSRMRYELTRSNTIATGLTNYPPSLTEPKTLNPPVNTTTITVSLIGCARLPTPPTWIAHADFFLL
jgi:hypothetical protein